MFGNRWSEIERMFGVMDLLNGRMHRLLGESGGDSWFNPAVAWAEGWPRTSLSDQGGHLVLTAELPGVSKDDLKVKVQGNYLEISGVRKGEVPEGYTVQRQERGTASFTRSFTLPVEIEAEKVEAVLTDGILNLTLPKAEAAKPKQITIH